MTGDYAPTRRRRGYLSVSLAPLLLLLPARALADSPRGARSFDIPAATADKSLPQLSDQSGLEILFGQATASRIRTNALKGNFTPGEALRLLLESTGLVAVTDAKTGAVSIRKETAGERARREKTAQGRPASRDTLKKNENPTPTRQPMKSNSLLARLAAALALFAPPTIDAAETTATVVGRVSNQATGAFLEGAEVSVPGTHVSTFTDREGSFSLQLPAGRTTIMAKYTGLQPQEIALELPAGETTMKNFELTSDVYRLETFTVAGEREGSALAITKQRLAESLRNVVASDSFGNVASGNVAEILQQIPGVAAIWDGADIRTVQIRGIMPELNAVTVNGDQMAQAQSGMTGRQFEFDTTSVIGFELLEVSKAPTPDLPANSIGGTINLVSKSAFDRKAGRLFTYSIGGVYRPKYSAETSNRWRQPIKNVGPAVNFSYSDIFGKNKNLGVILSFSAYGQPGGDTATFVDREWEIKDPLYIWRLRVPRPNLNDMFRTSYSAKVDYKLSPNTTLSLNGSYTWYYRLSDVRTMDLNPQRTIAQLDADGNRVGTGVIDPRYTNTFTRIYPSTANRSVLTASASDQTSNSYQFQPIVTHKLPGLIVEYGGSYSGSVSYFDSSEQNRHYKSRPKGSVTTTLTGIGWETDASKSRGWPSVTQIGGPDMYDLNNYGTMTLSQPDRGAVDEIITGKLNVKKGFATRLPTSLKLGGSYREQRRRLWNHSKVYTFLGADGVAGNAEDNLAQFVDREGRIDDDYFMGYQPAPYPSPYAAARHRIEHPEMWRLNEASAENAIINNRKRVSERVTAAYAMGTVRLRDLTILGGLRFERTEVKGSGPRRPTGGAAEIAEAEGDYEHVFPGLHLKYTRGDNWVARASYSTSIGRPSFLYIIPSDAVNHTSMTVTASNPGLLPQMSENFDVGIEYYFEPVGVLSASVFLKNLEDFHFSDNSGEVGFGPDNGFDGLYEGYQLVTRRNGGKGRYRGFELAYQQQLRFLPGAWSGLGVNFSYTYIETKGDYGTTVQTDKLSGFIPEYLSGSLSYNHGPWSLRLNGVWRSTYFANVNANPALMQYQRAKFTMSLKTLYKWRPHLSFFCDIDNLNASPVADFYYYRPENENYIRPGTQKIVAGIQGRF